MVTESTRFSSATCARQTFHIFITSQATECWNVHYFTNRISSDNFRKKIRHAGGFVIVIESAARRARLGADVESETKRLRRRVTKFLLSAAREITWKLYCPWIFHFFICSVSDTRAEVQSSVTAIVRFECVGDTVPFTNISDTFRTECAGWSIMGFKPLITAFLCRMPLSNSHNDILATTLRRWCLPGDNVRRESSVAGAIQGMCVVERARRLPGACATSPLATRFLRESARPRASSARNNLHNAYRRPGFYFRCGNHWNWILWCTGSITVIRVESQSRAVSGARCDRRDGAAGRGRRASGARAAAPLSVAPHWKVKVSGAGRGGTFLPLSLLWFILRAASRSLPATPAALLPARGHHVPPRRGAAAQRDVGCSHQRQTRFHCDLKVHAATVRGTWSVR